ncbi:MAG TPA: LysE/ArgO family amino acid transporter [Tahibacter sp.]|uniref:LysE/ArgO family amino acid transporter n=1 Tax=Tahibacter sp. TaxID=2056211 RepID=UPI002C107C18|nr:LysE/ArgO family amino acid transporter [Tahibacter sp.]HSX60276.1 LysE/ArgO family amino acid transporter [Tahibacter sp.]
MSLHVAASGFAASAGLIIAIGAQNAFVLRQGLQRRHIGLVVAVCMFGDIALILCGIAGIGTLVLAWPGLLQALRFGGAAFLAAYGFLAARRAWLGTSALKPAEAGESTWRRVLVTCLAFTFLNPHVYLDTMVLLGSIATQYPPSTRWTFAIGACSASIVWFASLGYGARLLQPVFRKRMAWRVLDGFIAAFMLTISVVLLMRSPV